MKYFFIVVGLQFFSNTFAQYDPPKISEHERLEIFNILNPETFKERAVVGNSLEEYGIDQFLINAENDEINNRPRENDVISTNFLPNTKGERASTYIVETWRILANLNGKLTNPKYKFDFALPKNILDPRDYVAYRLLLSKSKIEDMFSSFYFKSFKISGATDIVTRTVLTEYKDPLLVNKMKTVESIWYRYKLLSPHDKTVKEEYEKLSKFFKALFQYQSTTEILYVFNKLTNLYLDIYTWVHQHYGYIPENFPFFNFIPNTDLTSESISILTTFRDSILGLDSGTKSIFWLSNEVLEANNLTKTRIYQDRIWPLQTEISLVVRNYEERKSDFFNDSFNAFLPARMNGNSTIIIKDHEFKKINTDELENFIGAINTGIYSTPHQWIHVPFPINLKASGLKFPSIESITSIIKREFKELHFGNKKKDIKGLNKLNQNQIQSLQSVDILHNSLFHMEVVNFINALRRIIYAEEFKSRDFAKWLSNTNRPQQRIRELPTNYFPLNCEDNHEFLYNERNNEGKNVFRDPVLSTFYFNEYQAIYQICNSLVDAHPLPTDIFSFLDNHFDNISGIPQELKDAYLKSYTDDFKFIMNRLSPILGREDVQQNRHRYYVLDNTYETTDEEDEEYGKLDEYNEKLKENIIGHWNYWERKFREIQKKTTNSVEKEIQTKKFLEISKQNKNIRILINFVDRELFKFKNQYDSNKDNQINISDVNLTWKWNEVIEF